MTPQQLIGVALRVFSIWLALNSVTFLATVPGAVPQSLDGTGFKWGAFLVGGLGFALAVALWVLPMAMASALLPRTLHSEPLRIRGVELARVGCALIGLWVLVKSAPPLVWFFLRALLWTSNGSALGDASSDYKLELAIAVFNLVMGITLIRKAAWFGALVAGLDARPANPGSLDDEEGAVGRSTGS